MTEPNQASKTFIVNFIDTNDGITWVVHFQAASLDEAHTLAERYRCTEAMVPDDTELYTVAAENGSLLWWSSRFSRDPVPRTSSDPTADA